MKKFFSFALVIALATTLVPSFAGASRDVLQGANADLDFVYMDGAQSKDFTDEAEDRDRDYVPVFPQKNEDNQYLYLGSKSRFDRITFDVDRAASYSQGENLDWEYYEDGRWRNLSVNDSSLDGFTRTGTYTVSFSLPSDWDKTNMYGDSGFWVRVRPEQNAQKPAFVDQISARVYNVGLVIEDEDNDAVKDLSQSDFSVSGGTDNDIYGFLHHKNGEYWFALNAEASDTSYVIKIHDSRYDSESVTISSVSTNFKTYDIELDDDRYDRRDDRRDDDDDRIYLSGNDHPFRDLGNYWWAESAIEDLYQRGVIKGRSYSYYFPGSNITRAEFLKMLLLGADIDVEDYDHIDEDFRDVSRGAWYEDVVKAGIALDVIDDDYYFYPNSEINRAEAVTMLVRLQDELEDVYLGDTSTPFWDVSRYAWYAKYIAYAADEDIVEGYSNGQFKPGNTLNRAEAAVIVDRAYDAWWD